MFNGERKTVPLYQWERGMLSDDVWEVVGYSEFGYNGVPRYVELRRKEVEDVQDA